MDHESTKEAVAPKLADNARKKKIALVWADSPTQQINHHHSCSLEELVEIADTEQFDFYSLQVPLSL